MKRINILLAIIIVFGLTFSGGCVKRNLRVITDPPGATFYFNEKEMGTTPLDYDFMYYAIHKVEVKKDGYEPIKELVSIRAPLYFRIPFDLFFEIAPYDFWDRRELTYTLTPREEKDE